MKVKMPVATELSEYYKSYLKYVQTDDLLEAFQKQKKITRDFLQAVPADRETFRYGEGKWSVREIAGHLCDAERILTYRALCFARKDETPLPGFEENDYTANANYDELPLSEIADQLEKIRDSNYYLFKSFPGEIYDCSGLANNTRVSVRALLFFIIGHQTHHLNVIKERYLK